MELRATKLGRQLAQHPYDRVRMLNAGVEVSGEHHQYVIPFNQLIAVDCKRGVVWGELEFELAENKVVRLHGTDWQETQHFYHYLQQHWQAWSLEMAQISADVLSQQVEKLRQFTAGEHWFKRRYLTEIIESINACFQQLPLPLARLDEFTVCRDAYQRCLQWLHHGEQIIQRYNDVWLNTMSAQHADFFSSLEKQPFNRAQIGAVINGEERRLVLAGAGSGKTSVLIARAAWLLHRHEALPEQILLLAFTHQAAEQMSDRVQVLSNSSITVSTIYDLALLIVNHNKKKPVEIGHLLFDNHARQRWVITAWQQQCQEKKTQAKGWAMWLTEELGWELEREDYWQDEQLTYRLAPKLDQWLALLREQNGSQADWVKQAPESVRDQFQKRIRLMAPLLKAWKASLKAENALDFSGVMQQACALLEKGQFISPWKHLLIDDFQDVSPCGIQLLTLLSRQDTKSTLLAVGDDGQAICRYSGDKQLLTTTFQQAFAAGEISLLDTEYRFNQQIANIANGFIQQNSAQLAKTLNSVVDESSTKSVVILPQEKLPNLLDKMSGYVKNNQRILILARYYHLKPVLLEQAVTRWPNLVIDFMTIGDSKGQQADYVIVLGLHDGEDGWPAFPQDSVLEQVLLPQQEAFPYAEERRLLYVALTRARYQVWLLQDTTHPSAFVKPLRRLGAVVQRKP